MLPVRGFTAKAARSRSSQWDHGSCSAGTHCRSTPLHFSLQALAGWLRQAATFAVDAIIDLPPILPIRRGGCLQPPRALFHPSAPACACSATHYCRSLEMPRASFVSYERSTIDPTTRHDTERQGKARQDRESIYLSPLFLRTYCSTLDAAGTSAMDNVRCAVADACVRALPFWETNGRRRGGPCYAT